MFQTFGCNFFVSFWFTSHHVYILAFSYQSLLLSLDKTEEKGKNFKIDFLFLFSRSKHVLGILHLRN